MSYNPFTGVASFNGRQGAVTLTYSDVTGALGFTPTTVSGAVSAVAAAIGAGLAKSNGSALSAAVAATDFVAPGAATGSGLTMATARLLGRTTTGSGAIEELSAATVKTLLGITAADVSGLPATIIAQSAVAASVTGTTTETTLATITVPANAMGANGRIEITTMWSTTNSANNKTLRVKFGGTTFQSITMTTNASIQVPMIIANRNATNLQVASPNSSTGSGATTNAVQTAAIDTTAAVTILLTGQLANTGETITLEAYSVKLFK